MLSKHLKLLMLTLIRYSRYWLTSFPISNLYPKLVMLCLQNFLRIICVSSTNLNCYLIKEKLQNFCSLRNLVTALNILFCMHEIVVCKGLWYMFVLCFSTNSTWLNQIIVDMCYFFFQKIG